LKAITLKLMKINKPGKLFMRQSKYFLKTSKTSSSEEPTVNGKLLEQAGYVDKLMAGVYSYLPLGLRVLNNIAGIVREEMDQIGGQEVLMPMLHPKEIWETTGGWTGIDVLFKIASRTEREYALGQSEEEVVTPLVLNRLQSYKDFPLAVYQINWKFRDELRAKSGLLRGREFYMKDMYSFHTSQEDFDQFYAIAKQAYLKVFKRLGLVAKVTEASGGSFSQKISYEFMVLTDAGEDDILYCSNCDFCVNSEIAKIGVGDACPKSCGGTLAKARASEVGNVFDLGMKYGKDFQLGFTDEAGDKQFPVMGCYGIGISRLMGVIAEKCNDEHGLLWPESVAPFRVHLLALPGKDQEAVMQAADKLYEELKLQGVEVLYDDRVDITAGEKFADSDLLGIPKRLVVSTKTLAENSVEYKKRSETEAKLVKLDQIREIL
jgi:prolyl-tRNA synthetase